jgi:hypothetical protein
MAIGINATLPGVTAAQFDAMDQAVGSEPPAGLIFHASGPVDGGWQVIDFWESREQFEQFIAERVGPAMAQAGAAPPQISEFHVHEYLKP